MAARSTNLTEATAAQQMLRRTLAFEVIDAEIAGDRAAKSAAVARMIERCGLSRSRVYQIVEQVRREGARGVERRVRADAGATRFSEQLQEAWLRFALDQRRHHQSVVTRAKQFERAWRREMAEFPSVQTLRRWLADADPRYGQTTAEATRHSKRFLRMAAAYPNHVWQADQHQADFTCVERTVDPATGEVKERTFRPLLFTFIDVYSGAVMGAKYFEGAHTAYSTRVVEATLLQAMYPDPEAGQPFCGTPEIIYWDNGKPHHSRWMARVAEALGITLEFSKPKDPTSHGFIEGFHTILIQRFEMLQAGYVGSSPTDKPLGLRLLAEGEIPTPDYHDLESANRALAAFLPVLHEASYQGGACRRMRWEANVTPERRAVPAPDQLALAFMEHATATVYGGAFQHRTVRYTGPGLGEWHGLTVELRYLEGDFRRVWVYGEGRLICEAAPQQAQLYADISNRRALEDQRREMADSRRVLRQSRRALEASAQAGLVDEAAAEAGTAALGAAERGLRGEQGLRAVPELTAPEPARQMELPEGVVRLQPTPGVRDLDLPERTAPDMTPYLVHDADDDELEPLALDYL